MMMRMRRSTEEGNYGQDSSKEIVDEQDSDKNVGNEEDGHEKDGGEGNLIGISVIIYVGGQHYAGKICGIIIDGEKATARTHPRK